MLKPKKKEKEKEKEQKSKSNLKERLAEKKKKEKEKEEKGKSKKKAGVGGGKGRPAGVKYQLKKKVKDILEKKNNALSKAFEKFQEAYDSFIEKGNKSQAKKAREHLMEIYKAIKDFRKDIQKAKQEGLEVVKDDD